MNEQLISGEDWLPGLTDPEEIGRGGFGVVYRAKQSDLNRTVAVKILSGNLDDLALQRFDRERRAMGALSGHPNIVPVYSTGLTDDNRPYLVMEFLPGGSMSERAAVHGLMSWQDTAEVGVRLCAALETAHRAGVLHRDVKPENIFISGLGSPKLGDFGIARLEGSPQTQSAMITASLAHAAPELIDGKPPSVQSDIYSLASTLVTLMTGAPPFSRDTDDSIVPLLARIATEPLPDLRPRGVPDHFCLLFERAMAKDPGARYDSVADFGRAVQGAQGSGGVDVTPLEVQGIDPTITPGSGAPVAADPTVNVAPPPPPPVAPPVAPPVTTPPPVAPPVTTPPPAAQPPPAPQPPPPVTTSPPAARPPLTGGPPPGPAPVIAPGYTTGVQSAPNKDKKKVWLAIAGGVAALLLVVLVLALMAGGDEDTGPSVTRPDVTLRDRVTDPGVVTATTLEPGSVGLNGLVVTELPFDLGDNDALDEAAAACAAGDPEACDSLFAEAPINTMFEEFGATCGARIDPDVTTLCRAALGLD